MYQSLPENDTFTCMLDFFFIQRRSQGRLHRTKESHNCTIKRDSIPNTASVHHIQIHITQNPTNRMTNIVL